MNIMTVRAPDDIREKLARYSNKRGITRNALILVILDDWIRQQENNVSDSDTGKEVRT